MERWTIKNHVVEYDDSEHMYIVDGIIVPSVTQILKLEFGGKYDFVPKAVLSEAARRGTLLHSTIEAYEKLLRTQEPEEVEKCFEVESEVNQEFRSWKFLKRQYGFDVIDNEIPLIIPFEGEIVAAGRMDLLLKKDEQYGVADIKRTSVLDRNYLSYQLTIYGMGLEYCYDIIPEFWRCVWLREDKRKYERIKPCTDLAKDLLRRSYEMQIRDSAL